MTYTLEMIQREQMKIRSLTKDEPSICPACNCATLYPIDGEHAPMNSLSRIDNETYVCNLCGHSEAMNDIRDRA